MDQGPQFLERILPPSKVFRTQLFYLCSDTKTSFQVVEVRSQSKTGTFKTLTCAFQNMQSFGESKQVFASITSSASIQSSGGIHKGLQNLCATYRGKLEQQYSSKLGGGIVISWRAPNTDLPGSL